MFGRGVYALLLSLPQRQTLSIGQLGQFEFPAGFYLYLGSALGPGGLEARLRRHIRRDKKRHWHIDWLRASATLEVIWARRIDTRLECDWARTAATLPAASIPAPRFGASDCHCPSHLYHYPARPALADFTRALGHPAGELDEIQPSSLAKDGTSTAVDSSRHRKRA